MLLYAVLALLLAFSLIGVPKIVGGVMNATKGKIVTLIRDNKQQP